MFLRRVAVLAFTLAVGVALAAPVSAAPKAQAPKAPTNLRITASSTFSVTLAWNAPTVGGSNWWYCVARDGQGCIRVDPPTTTIVRSGLLPATTFNFSVYVVTASGQRSAHSNTVSYTTPADTTAPSPAPVVSVVAVYPTRISVSWTVSKDDTSQVWYDLLVDGAPYVSGAIGLNSWTLFYLEPLSTHTFQVTARDRYFNVASSSVVSVTTPEVTDTTPPTAPTSLTLGFQSTDFEEAWLNWTQSTDNADPQSLILYEVYLNGVLNHDGVVGWGSTVTYCRVPGPTSITLRAVDTSGNRSGPSNAVQFPC